MDEANWLVHEADDAINFYLSQMRESSTDDKPCSSIPFVCTDAQADAQLSTRQTTSFVSTDPQLDAQPSTSRSIPISASIEELSPTFTGKPFF